MRLMRWLPRLLKTASAILFLLSAAAISLVEFLAIVDPAGTKMADDLDAFGDPYVPWTHHVPFLVAILGLVAGAVVLLRHRKKN